MRYDIVTIGIFLIQTTQK